MSFAEYLKKHADYEKYDNKYIRYDVLTKLIAKEDISKHAQIIQEEFNRVFDFINRETEKFKEKLCLYEKEIKNEENEPFEKSKSKKHILLDKNNYTIIFEDLQEEMKSFAEFIRINIIGFKKLIKHSDKRSGLNLKGTYSRILEQKLNAIDHLDALIYQNSKLNLKLKDKYIEQDKKESNINNLAFIRKTNKYWVHMDNLMALKLAIVRHLPVYVFTEKKQENAGNISPYAAWNHKTHDTCVSSVYFDNEDHELYMGRLQKNEGAEAIRIRFYGDLKNENNVVFVERKRHCESWTGEKSKKLRFKIKEKYVDDFITGKDIWKHVKEMNVKSKEEKTKTDNEEEVKLLYNEIQSAILNQNLFPSVRTFYKRIAFQLPNDNAVRISLDTNLCMIDERAKYIEKISKNFKIKESNFTNRLWRRSDFVNTEWPFRALDDKNIVRFPHAILEVKTTSVDETKPKWIENILASAYVEHVHKFSKFLHGTAILHMELEKIPYWLPQMRTDIRKDEFLAIGRRKEFNGNYNVSEVSSKTNSKDTNSISNSILDHSDHKNNLKYLENNTTRINIPVRVEPKVFFANERTFLRWVQFSIFLGGLGTAMLGLESFRSNVCGAIMVLLAILFACYALHLFAWRAEKIRNRDPGPYDDGKGPIMLIGMFVVALIFSVIFKFPMKGGKYLIH